MKQSMNLIQLILLQ